MSTLLRRELAPLSYANCLNNQGEFDQGTKEQLAAQLGGVSVAEVIELNNAQQERLRVYSFALPERVRGDVAYGIRSGVENPDAHVPLAPRGGFRLRHLDRASILPGGYPKTYTSGILANGEISTRRLTGGMDTKSALIGERVLWSLKGIGGEDASFIGANGELMSGGKGEIIFPIHPRALTPKEKEASIRGYVRRMFEGGLFTEKRHRMGPDMFVLPEDMDNARDELIRLGCNESEAGYYITGKSIDAGGIPGRLEATGRGGAVALDEYLQLCEVPAETAVSYSLMGYGNVGEHFAHQLKEVSKYKFSLQSVGDEKGVLHDSQGIEPEVLSSLVYFVDDNGNRKSRRMDEVYRLYRDRYPSRQINFLSDSRDWLKVKTDVYVPAAIGFEVDMDNVHDLTSQIGTRDGVPIVFPLSNNGVSSQAQLELEIKRVRTFLYSHINIGGVAESNDESLYALSPRSYDVMPEGYFLTRLDTTMRDLTAEAFGISHGLDEPVSMHTAAEAMRIMGLVGREKLLKG